jgi:hypothetical protein
MRHFANPEFINISEAYSITCYSGNSIRTFISPQKLKSALPTRLLRMILLILNAIC